MNKRPRALLVSSVLLALVLGCYGGGDETPAESPTESPTESGQADAPAKSDKDGAPSSVAAAMPGATGTFAFQPVDWQEGETTFWLDSEGVSPGEPGCHIGADENGTPNGRMFGEACLPDGRLVESNPGKDELHSHGNDTGHPDTFDCDAWCKGQGSTSGICQPMPAPPCPESAACVCEPPLS
ncbi:MAG: hypothetical protein QNK05_04275 [Myxococcota bacterium]|nr:hypothetical protein [Myxococcota bacterium]